MVDRVLRQEGVLVGAVLGTNVIDVGDELAAELVDQIEEGMTVEVAPDQSSDLGR